MYALEDSLGVYFIDVSFMIWILAAGILCYFFNNKNAQRMMTSSESAAHLDVHFKGLKFRINTSIHYMHCARALLNSVGQLIKNHYRLAENLFD